MFSQTSEYALRVVVYLASQGGQPRTTSQIAAATRVPEGYLSKVLQALGRAALVKAQRGLHGGFVLDRDPQGLTIYDVVMAVDTVQRIRSCPLGIESHGTRLCAVHRRMDDALAMVEKVFRDSTIAELLAQSTGSEPLCDVKPVVHAPVIQRRSAPTRPQPITPASGRRR
jgi:Rrf2 family protein